MDFTVAKSKTGKPNILFNNYKYRESYTLKTTGEITWRCLGQTCKATLKTDSNKTKLSIVNNKHTGRHPVTMRNFASPKSGEESSASPAGTVTPGGPSRSRSPASTESPSPASSTPRSRSSSEVDGVASLEYTQPEELLLENERLKEKVNELQKRVSDLLNHSIESDSRLLQFTDQLFVANLSSSAQSTVPPADQDARPPAATVDCGVQCEPPGEMTSAVDYAVQCQPPPMTACDRDACRADRDLILSLKTTIDVLEAEIECLKLTLKASECGVPDKIDAWTKIQSKKPRVPVELKNKFNPLFLEKKSVNFDANPQICLSNDRTNTNKKHGKKHK